MHLTRIMTGILAVGLLVAALFMTGCTTSPQVYTESSNGQTVSVTKDSMVTVKLRENPTTGYRWNVTLSDGLSLISDEYVPDKVPANMVGSGGTHVWNIQPQDTGTYTFSAIYARSWENITGSESTYTLTIVAK